jgi:hypothetical protein
MVSRTRGVVLVVALMCCVSVASADPVPADRADPVLEWNEIMIDMLAGRDPASEVRIAAIMNLAVFEAVNAITHEYRPYLGTVEARPGASPEAAAIAAAHAVLRFHVPDRASALDRARARSLAAIADGAARQNGIAVGEAAAAAMIEHRTGDGSELAESHIPASTRPGEWQLTDACPGKGGVLKHWANVKPFGILRNDQFRTPLPPALTSKRYAQAYDEIKRHGGAKSSERTRHQADLARLYEALFPLRVWNTAAVQVAAAQRRSLTHNARVLALLDMAMNDAGVALVEVKYRVRLWRPETAIHAGDTDGNDRTEPDLAFVPFLITPCHPSYPGGHAATAHAARSVLEREYGRAGHSITLFSSDVPDVLVHYASFAQITADIDDARVYGGVHFRFDQEAGASLGRRIGRYVQRNHLRRVR